MQGVDKPTNEIYKVQKHHSLFNICEREKPERYQTSHHTKLGQTKQCAVMKLNSRWQMENLKCYCYINNTLMKPKQLKKK